MDTELGMSLGDVDMCSILIQKIGAYSQKADDRVNRPGDAEKHKADVEA